jgi:hypothetical protein
LYGNGANESLIGPLLKPVRQRIVLASKCGINHPASGEARRIDGRPASIKASCEASLRRLQTDVIDLFYLHRWDKDVPIEDSVGALADLVQQGKIRTLGLSEVSAQTLRRAHAVHPIAAVQTEYSLWTRNPEIAVLQTCAELGVSFVAFSPLARAFLTDTLHDPSQLHASDIRRQMPRFDAVHYPQNLALLSGLKRWAAALNCTPSQLALAWVLQRSPITIAIPGTTKVDHLQENLGAAQVVLTPAVMSALEALFAPNAIAGPRYNAINSAEVDTENF